MSSSRRSLRSDELRLEPQVAAESSANSRTTPARLSSAGSRSPYLTVRNLTKLVETLSQRDLDIVSTLKRVRVATGSQLQRLHYVDGTARSNARRTQRDLRRLVELSVLARFGRIVGGRDGGGSTQSVYVLDRAGQRLAAGRGPAGGKRVERPWTPGHSFVAHGIDVTEVFVSLTELERAGRLRLMSFAAEPECWRTYLGKAAQATTLKPDALITVRMAGADADDLYYVEVDRGTHSAASLGRKLAMYCDYFERGGGEGDVFPRVLVLVPDNDRFTVAVDVAGRQDANCWQLFKVARFADAARVFAEEGAL